MDEDPVGKCLDLAEKIIGCLNEGEILRRYLTVKKKIYESRPPSLSPHLKRLALEKRDLTQQLASIRIAHSGAGTLDAYVLAELESVHKIARGKMPDVQFRFSRQQVLEFDHRSRGRRDEIERKLARVKEESRQKDSERVDVEEENRGIAAAWREKRGVASEYKKKFGDLKQHSAVAEFRLKDLQRQVDRLRAESGAKEREIAGQRAAQRFGVREIGDTELHQLRVFESEVARLIRENEQIALELKKRRLLSGNPDVTEVSSISIV
jgi:hypothetical protein